MSPLKPIAALTALILLLAAAPAGAADDEAGVSLSPAEAVGVWTVESDGKSLCVLKLGAEKVSATAFALKIPASCGGVLPQNVAGWSPSAHGMTLVGADGQNLVGFGRWSNSLLVSHPSSGVDVQLRRGGPNS
jgi:hypothetical protein